MHDISLLMKVWWLVNRVHDTMGEIYHGSSANNFIIHWIMKREMFFFLADARFGTSKQTPWHPGEIYATTMRVIH